MENKLKELVLLNRKKIGEDELFNFLLDHIGKHIDEVKELKSKDDPHFYKEVADLYLLGYMLMLNENVNKEVVEERIKKIEGKINEN
ncbi:MAG: hypothetical protein QF632_03740 [Candidatus Woesearchaeota archaeon]|jgi:hypothetical protein|nr:hypothetical protein [Candidatus Woesearchaeota archaeon]MDP7323845.1 hypothetical protein [Candidatus Woesearchaeota archaeon]